MSARRGRKPVIPLTIVVGATGAGKTTLINRLLEDRGFTNTAVILNEFGEVALEGAVVERADDGVIALSAGCICCTVRGELVEALERLLRDLDNGRVAAIDRVVIEASGTADPAAIVGAVLRHPYLSLRFRPDGILAVVDVERLEPLLDGDAAMVRQTAMADVVVLTKRTPTAGEQARLARLHPGRIVAADALAPAMVKAHGAFDPAQSDPAAWIGVADEAVATPVGAEERRINAFVVERRRSIPAAALDRFIDYLAVLHGANLIRVRGVAAIGEGAAMVVEGIGGFFYPPTLIDGYEASHFAVSAAGLDRATFEGYLDAFLNEARIDNPDRQALTDNPLAIAGFSARGGR